METLSAAPPPAVRLTETVFTSASTSAWSVASTVTCPVASTSEPSMIDASTVLVITLREDAPVPAAPIDRAPPAVMLKATATASLSMVLSPRAETVRVVASTSELSMIAAVSPVISFSASVTATLIDTAAPAAAVKEMAAETSSASISDVSSA